jgi:prolyl oligopeptidase PreP (S9A serine peptidase family)
VAGRPAVIRLAVAASLLVTVELAWAQGKPPVAPVKEVKDTCLGVEVSDPYRYLEAPGDPEAAAWMKAQANHTRAVLDSIPGLFGMAVDDVPMSDVVRSELGADGLPNVPEFGSVKTVEGFRGLYAMSPYHWVKDGVPYPAVLVTTGANDPRVDAWQAAEMAARLRATTSSGKPVLLRIDYEAGHGFGSTQKQTYEIAADRFSFLLWQAGVKEFQPR